METKIVYSLLVFLVVSVAFGFLIVHCDKQQLKVKCLENYTKGCETILVNNGLSPEE